MRRPTTPPPFGPRIQTLGISVLFAVAGQCTTRRFHGPECIRTLRRVFGKALATMAGATSTKGCFGTTLA